MDANVNQNKHNAAEKGLSRWQRLRAFWNSDRKSARYPKAVLHSLWRIAGEAVALCLGLVFVWVYLANYVAAQKKVDISFLSHNASTWFAGAFEGKSGDVGNLNLEWLPSQDVVKLTAGDVVVADKTGEVLESVAEVTSTIGVKDAIAGNYVPKTIQIEGGSVTWRRFEDGRVLAGLGTPDTVGRFGVFLDQKPDTQRKDNDRNFSLGRLESVTTRNTTVYVVDDIGDVDFQVLEARLDLSHVEDVNTLKLGGRLEAGKEAGEFELDTTFSSDLADFTMMLDVEKLLFSQIAPKVGRFHELSDIDVPLTGALSLSSARNIGLEEANLKIKAGAGKFKVLNIAGELDAATLDASYDTEARQVQFKTLDIKSDNLKLKGRLSLSNVGTPETAFRSDKLGYDFDLSSLYIDLTNIFDAPFEYEGVKSSGSWLAKQKRLEVSSYEFTDNQHKLAGRLGAEFAKSGKITQLEGSLSSGGEFLSNDFLAYWPTEFVPGARRWIFKAIQSGRFTNFDGQFNLDEAGLSGAPLRDDQLKLEFGVENANVKYMDHLPAYLGASANGVLQGNRLTVMAAGGTVGTMQLKDGLVTIPRLRPKGGDFTIDVNGSGSVSEMLRIIDNKTSRETERYHSGLRGLC